MSLGFSIPGSDRPAVALPAEVQSRIDQSVKTFEAKFTGFGMLTLARSSGWIEEYRKELVELALLCLRRESAGKEAGVGGPG
ncbi:MAG: hypothetical protein WAN65_01965 [Candidatus Sulfotelmatobacter sp.]